MLCCAMYGAAQSQASQLGRYQKILHWKDSIKYSVRIMYACVCKYMNVCEMRVVDALQNQKVNTK